MDNCPYSQEISESTANGVSEPSGQVSHSRQNDEASIAEGPEDTAASGSIPDRESSLEGFEIISDNGIPEAGSEALLLMNNAPSITGAVAECLQELSNGYLAGLFEIPTRLEIPNLGVWNYIGTFFHDPLACVDEEDINGTVNTFFNGISSFEDELRRRECLVRTLSDNFKEIIEEFLAKGSGMDLLTFLERKGCISQADSLYLRGKHEDPATLIRLLCLMILNRDLKTQSIFVWILKFVSKSLFEKVTQQFNTDINSGPCRMALQCLRCTLMDRVDIHLVADCLLGCRSCNMRKLYGKIVEAKRAESEDLWKELFNNVKSKAICREVRDAILKAIRDCGFHSDILKMIQGDNNQDTNNFDCRCNESLACSVGRGHTDPASGSDSRKPNCDAIMSDHLRIEETNRHTVSDTACTRTQISVDSSENATSEKHVNGSRLQSTIPDEKVNSEDFPCQSNSLKRKNVEIGDNVAEGFRKKKSSNLSEGCTRFSESQSNCNDETCISCDKTLKLQRHSTLNHTERSIVKCDSASVSKEVKCRSATDDGSNHLKMDELKEAVEDQPDSGVSPDPSLTSFRSENSDIDTDSGCYDQNTRDRHETIRKEIATIPKQSLQEVQNPVQIPYQHGQHMQGNTTAANNLATIDADHPENADLDVNHDALSEALDEPSLDEDCDASATGNIHNILERTFENGQNEQKETNEPFINLKIKRNS